MLWKSWFEKFNKVMHESLHLNMEQLESSIFCELLRMPIGQGKFE